MTLDAMIKCNVDIVEISTFNSIAPAIRFKTNQ